MPQYIVAIENLFRIEAEDSDEAHEQLRERLRDGEFFGPTDIELKTVDIEE